MAWRTLVICLVLAQLITVAFADLQGILENLVFTNKGVVTSSDRYAWKEQPCDYLEAENVTNIENTWVVTKKFNYLYQRQDDGQLIPPPIGIRSAVPLGGITTGYTELRADGVFREWTIQNQTPAGGAKITSLPDLLFGLRTMTSTGQHAAVLQTHPMAEVVEDVPGVKQIEYSGTYPVSKLKYLDPNIPVDTTLFAYSTYKVGDMKASAVPAIAFTFVIKNPSSSSAVDVSLMMNLPTANYRTERTMDPSRKKATVSATNTVQNAKDCFNMCAKNTATKKCLTWTFDAANKKCYLYENPQMNLNNFNDTTQSGFMGTWSQLSGVNCLNYNIDGPPIGPTGDIATCVLSDNDDMGSSFATDNDVFSMLQEVRKYGHLKNIGVSAVGLHGASSVNFSLAAGQSRTVTFLLAWNYPNRDFFGKILGNQYAHLFKSVNDAASYVKNNQMSILNDISALNGAFMNSSLNPFLSDVLINSLSHIRSALWYADSRWRQWEALDCSDIDSVHNDGERHIPYIMFYPDSVRNKLQAWAKFQITDIKNPNYGMIQEYLRAGCVGMPQSPTLDQPGGRVMSDVSSMFILYVLELYRWGNDVTSLKTFYPNVKQAAKWHLNVTSKYGVLTRMVNTYDVLNQNKYDLCSYNSAFHLLAMAAARELATAMGDTDMATQCQTAFLRAQDAMDKLQWNETAGYYNSYSNLSQPFNPGALMSDTFYSQVLAYSMGLGLLLKNESRLVSHNKQTMKINDTPYGLMVQTGRYTYPGPSQDNAIWQMANPNWAAISIHLGQDVDMAMAVANKTLNRWRENENDLWNVPGISGGVGYGAEAQPFITSHYGYYMSSWHLVFALSGQQANLPDGTLTFAPPTKAQTWSYPIMLPGVLGVVSQNGNNYKVEINLGEVTIGKKLSVNGVDSGAHYPITLKPGSVVSWSK